MKTTSIGQQAERAVAAELQREGYSILARNWKTKVCEIDIVAQKGKVIYFAEVKFRSSLAQGSGLEYIGPQKLKRLNFAAALWCQSHSWSGDYQLLGASVGIVGSGLIVQEIIELD